MNTGLDPSLVVQWAVIVLAVLASAAWLLRGWIGRRSVSKACATPATSAASACGSCRGCEVGRRGA
jgi:hypothetical protein